MPSGFECYNQDGVLQFSTDSSNFYMVEKNSITLTTGIYVDISPTVEFDCIAVSGVGILPKGMFATTQAANTTVRFRKTATTGTLNWYAFRSYKHLSPAASGVGLEIYNADGTVGYSTIYPKLLRVVQKVAVPNQTNVSATLPSGITYAFLAYGTTIGSITYTEAMGGGTATGSTGPITTLSGTSLTIDVNTRVSRTYNGGGFTGGVAAIDVTNF